MPRKKFNLNINKIRQENNDEKIKDLSSKELNTYEKRINILIKEKTTNNLISKDSETKKENENIILIDDSEEIPNKCSFSYSDSTMEDSYKYDEIRLNKTYEESFLNYELLENILNLARKTFYLEKKLYDIPLTQNKNSQLCKYLINEDYSIFVYPNKTSTYSFVISGFFKRIKINDDNSSINEEIKNNEFYQKFGLYFCEKDTILKDGKQKKCSPNEFMCKECIEKNKNIYKLKDNYMINILGRVAKKNKGKYHCFGHFLVNNTFEDCITKFTCEGCKLLNFYSEYYES